MADENTQVNDGQVDDSQTDDTQVDGVEDKPQSEGEFVDETLDYIKETQKAAIGEDDSGADDSDDGVVAYLKGKDIPDAYTEAAEAAGMSKEEIITHANKHTDEELLEEAQGIQDKLKQLDAVTEEGKDKVTEQDDKKGEDEGNKDEVDPELVKSITEKISKELAEKFGTTLEKINEFEAHQEEQSARQTVETASKIFDDASKKYPVFGKTDELPRFASGRLAGELITTSPEMKARLEVLRYADTFMKTGDGIDDAMAKALGTYAGLHLEKESKRNTIRDFKNHETKLSGARVWRETKKKHANTRDEIIDDIAQMQRAAGIDV